MDRDSRFYRPPSSRTKFKDNFNSNYKNNYSNNQLRKRRTDYEPNLMLNLRKEIYIDYDKIEKKIKNLIPEIVAKFTLASYKEIEEELEKFGYSKNEFNYLNALDELVQSKKIHLVNERPDVFSNKPNDNLDEEKKNRYLIYLKHLKELNTIKNAPKKSSSNKSINNDYNSSNTKSSKDSQNSSKLLNDNTISSTTSKIVEDNQKIDDYNETKTDIQSSQITSSDNLNNEPENQVEENCKEESIKDLSNRIVIKNMVAPKTGDKQKAKRRKARRIRKATKNSQEKKAKAAKEQEENQLKNDGLANTTEDDDDDDEQIITSTNNKNNSQKQKQSKQQKSKSSNQKQNDENLKYENSSQISSSSDSEESLELLPDSEIYPSPEIYQKISDAGFDYESIITRFANWNRSPISALNEFGQICHISVKLEITDSTGPDHAKLFQATAFLDKKKLAIAWGKSKKRAKGCASELAIRAITASLPTERCDLDIQKYTNHFDQLAVLSYAKFNELLVLVPNYVNFGRKIVATILMKTSEDTYGKAIAVGTGNRCVSGEHLVTDGKVIFDSHAEVIARRSFLNFLIKQVEFYKTGEKESIFIKDEESDLLVVKSDVTFHLYISTAPCGDGALFTHSSNQSSATELESENHEPLFETFLHGRLRTKMEAGEGTISLDENYSSPELDQILRGERLRTMSCSDKICRWNLLGIQGCLLLHFIKPIYLSSISLGALYHNGHLSRACCCRLEQDYFKDKLDGNKMFKINHPSLGCPTSFKFPREPVKTKSDSLNWSLFEDVPELTNGNTGVKFNMEESRICKRELFNRFKNLCTLFGKDDLNELTYFEVKEKVEYYNELKRSFFDYLKIKKYGPWVCKPIETKIFK